MPLALKHPHCNTVPVQHVNRNNSLHYCSANLTTVFSVVRWFYRISDSTSVPLNIPIYDVAKVECYVKVPCCIYMYMCTA